MTDWHEAMRCIKKSDQEQYFALNVGARPFGITTYAPDTLPVSQCKYRQGENTRCPKKELTLTFGL